MADVSVTIDLYGSFTTITLDETERDRLETLAKQYAAENPNVGVQGGRVKAYQDYLNKIGPDSTASYPNIPSVTLPGGLKLPPGLFTKDLPKEDPVDTRSIPQKLADAKYGCNWNLPPHSWSLPYNQGRTSPLRRGRIFHYYTNTTQGNVVMEGVTENNVGVNKKFGMKEDPEYDYTFKVVKPAKDNSGKRKYGFQFLWNPESYSMSTALQAEMTPSPGDAFAAGHAMFPGTSNLQFTIRVDRVNDFACLLGQKVVDPSSGRDVRVSRLLYSGSEVTKLLPNDLCNTYIEKYYKERIPGQSTTKKDSWSNGKHQIHWLLRYGTLADIEYIYRAVNDIAIVSKPLPDGFTSADVGYMAFSLVAVELGPIYYIGYITGMSINHLLFNEHYVPIRSDVTLSMNLMAQASATPSAMNKTITGGVPTDSGQKSTPQ